MTQTPIAVPSTQTAREVESQPAIWSRVAAEFPGNAAVLPVAGTPVLFVGCGTSYYIGESYARRRNDSRRGRTRAAIASEVPYLDDEETVVVLSRSGTTTDVIRFAAAVHERTRVIGIIGAPDTPLIGYCHECLLLDYADERSVVQTRFATSALMLLRLSLGEELGHLPAEAEAALALPLPGQPVEQVVFLGSGWTIGLAAEAALKCREAAGAWTESYAIREYQHGPISVAGPHTLIWSLTPVPTDVRRSIEATGARIVEPDLDPQAQLVAVHRLALLLAEAAGRDPDKPPFLSRSVASG